MKKKSSGNDVIAEKTEELNKDYKTVQCLVFPLKDVAVYAII